MAAEMKFPGETLVTVCSALGQKTGQFYWPTDCLPMLEFWNSSRRGFYFAWDKVDDFNAPKQIIQLRLTVEKALFPNET
jgi:hypothetical protein